mmetsp:Transcript_16380/g.40379  ORF Transcript_16380/g.40379 Transcript_16380/m.40379 type:complete len:184 (+) Transcript_16380:209-760(+)
MGSAFSFCRPAKAKWQVIVGFGSLLSEVSARGSFPSLRNFRRGKLRNWKRVFAHPAAIFFERGIARMETREIASLSIEPCEGEEFYVALFEISDNEMPTFYAREEEFKFVTVSVEEEEKGLFTEAIACARGTDELFIERWGQDTFHQKYKKNGIESIWNFEGKILPCRVTTKLLFILCGVVWG